PSPPSPPLFPYTTLFRSRLGRTAAGEGSRARRRRSPMTTTDITPVDFDEAIDRFDPVLGIEVHVELGTVTKMFDGAPNIFAAEPNTAITPTSLGLPGSLPVVNGRAVEYAIRIGLALNCSIAETCRFARKQYFYPDLTKNFQTSQY